MMHEPCSRRHDDVVGCIYCLVHGEPDILVAALYKPPQDHIIMMVMNPLRIVTSPTPTGFLPLYWVVYGSFYDTEPFFLFHMT
jgi:hypothetical protein